MSPLKVGAAVLNQTPIDWPGNAQNIRRAIESARAEGVRVLCLPELCLPGYGCEDVYLSPALHQTSQRLLAELLPHCRDIVVCLGLPIVVDGEIYNAEALVVDGHIAGVVGKRFLAGTGIYYEPRWFKPWPQGETRTVEVAGQTVPFGDIYFDFRGIKIGFEICEDAWVADRPGKSLADRGVHLILNPSASHFAFGKHEIRKDVVVGGSKAFDVAYVYSNELGNASGRAIYDGGALIAQRGELLAAGPRFSFRDVVLTTALVDVGSSASRMHVVGDDCVAVDYDLATSDAPRDDTQAVQWASGTLSKEEEFTRAITLGLFDYLRKSRSRGFVVSLSGGADSAAVACLCALTFEMASAEIGEESLRKKLAYANLTNDTLASQLLTCVYQATRNSGDVTLNAARDVAEAVDALFYEFDVDQLVQGYTDMVAGAIGRELSWERDDIALQNIQARARAPGVWMLANLSGALLLSTSNRSEAAVGYATMDGDTAGGLSPIAGIDKAFLKAWLSWLELEGPQGGRAIAALSAINRQAPTAELRPPSSGQTDEDDLMPYVVLDAIERAAIRDRQAPVEAFETLRGLFPQQSIAQVAAWVDRFFRLWCRNQWKRERYAPSFHVDDENLDPKTWCRFPILSGGFIRELDELRDHVGTLSDG